MKVLCVVGARPNFMKVTPIIAAIRKHNARNPYGGSRLDYVLVHTGQHYDEAMSDSFFRDLNLPEPDVHLGVGSASHAAQTAEIMKKFEPVLLSQRPDVLVVVGDVNSTLACALVAAKAVYDDRGKRPWIAHVEGGLRSFDRTMPEEVNRIVTDHISDFLFVTEESGIRNLKNEGIPPEKIFFVGNTMIDTLFRFRDQARKSAVLEELGLTCENDQRNNSASNRENGISDYALLTLHRPSNVDNRNIFMEILAAVKMISKEVPVVFPCHPRTKKKMEDFNLQEGCEFLPVNGLEHRKAIGPPSILLTSPLGYVDFLKLMSNAKIVLTDSGGIQEETTCLGVSCITLRENTERPVTIEQGTNILAGTDKEKIVAAFRTQQGRSEVRGIPKFWDGKAAERIVEVIVRQAERQDIQ